MKWSLLLACVRLLTEESYRGYQAREGTRAESEVAEGGMGWDLKHRMIQDK